MTTSSSFRPNGKKSNYRKNTNIFYSSLSLFKSFVVEKNSFHDSWRNSIFTRLIRKTIHSIIGARRLIMNPKFTGEFISQLRKEKKLTQSELAELLQVTDKAISRWEVGDGYPDVSILPRLSTILGVTVDEILSGKRKEDVDQSAISSKNNFITFSIICSIVIVFGYLFSVALFYVTETESNNWLCFIFYILFTVIGLVFYLLVRNRFLIHCKYTDEDKKVIFRFTRLIYFTIIITAFLFLPIIIPLSNQLFSISVKPGLIEVKGIQFFGTYLFVAFLFGLIGLSIALVTSIYHRMIVFRIVDSFNLFAITLDICFANIAILIAMNALNLSLSYIILGLIFLVINSILTISMFYKKMLSKRLLIIMVVFLAFNLFVTLLARNAQNEVFFLQLAGVIVLIILLFKDIKESLVKKGFIKFIYFKNILLFTIGVSPILYLFSDLVSLDFEVALYLTRIITIIVSFAIAFSDILLTFKSLEKINV